MGVKGDPTMDFHPESYFHMGFRIGQYPSAAFPANLNPPTRNTPALIVTHGLPSSGKTTWARSWVACMPGRYRVNKDDIRAMAHDSHWTGGNEKQVIAARDAQISTLLSRGHSVVCDDTNLVPKHIERFRQITREHSAHLVILDFTGIPVRECVKADEDRAQRGERAVGRRVIVDQWHRFLAFTYEPTPHTLDTGEALIVDLDGTLAVMGDRSPYDWEKVGVDTVNPFVAGFVRFWYDAYEQPVVILSGRDMAAFGETQKWLSNHEIPYTELFLRAAGDNRPDWKVKKEMFYASVHDRYNPVLVVDDRQQVVDMWRYEVGLPVWQVAEHVF